MKDTLTDEFKALIFKVGTEEYALDLNHVLSIERDQTITKVPCMPTHMLGVFDLRGTITPVFDLTSLMYAEKIIQSSQRYIVVNVGGKTTAFAVDDATEVITIPIGDIQTDNITNGDGFYLKGYANIDNRLLLFVDVEKLMIFLTSEDKNLHDKLSLKEFVSSDTSL